MKLFAVRHAETIVGDTLTVRGREQAIVTAEYLLKIGFSGKIYSEPSAVCKETAALMSTRLGKCGRVKRFFGDFLLPSLSSTPIVQQLECDKVHRDAKYPFERCAVEAIKSAMSELSKSIGDILEKESGDILLILSTATHSSLLELFHPERYYHTRVLNCALSLVSSDNDEQTYGYFTDHLPSHLLSDNGVEYSEILSQSQGSLSLGERFFDGVQREKRVLHIGDTHFCLYPFYQQMIERLRPGVIIHTGDISDEAKAGRYEKDKERWLARVPLLINALRSSGARVIIVPGNNDIEDFLKSLSGIEYYPKNTVLDIEGKRVCLCHEVFLISPDIEADVYLYGHGVRGETRAPNSNEEGGACYFNASWGPSLHVFGEDRHLVLPPADI